MKRLISLIGLTLLLVAPFALAATIGEPDAGSGRWATPENGRVAHNGDVVYRCGTDDHGRRLQTPDMEQIQRFIDENRIAAGGVIPVNVHVIYNGSEGNVSDAMIDAQILVLNRNFGGRDYNGNVVSGASNTGYTFTKASTTRTNSRQWFRMTPGSKAERDAKNALCVNQTSSLNLYTAKPGQNLLGWATFPQDIAANGKMDGVVIHYASLPGGALAPYNLGGTGSHEVGHWVGLYHTFQGGCGTSNCSTSGDLVCDTPAQGTATGGCPTGKDTCPAAGLDPIRNYMDYSTDICYTNFTAGQDARADFLMSTYRPSIGSARMADAEPADDFRPTEENGKNKADNGEEVYRCATDHRGAQVKAPKKSEIDLWIQENRIAAGGVIPVNFHVIYGNRNEGNVPESWLDAQITVLNHNYAGRNYGGSTVPGAANTGYTFVKASVTRTNNRKWFGMTPGSSAEAQAKNALRVNPTGSLNFYTAKPSQNLLGWATFPWNLAGNPNMDGVVVHYASLPGGSLAPYNLGGTGSHEVGHWVGLYHTFQGGCGSDCATTGDLVCDTPAQGTATAGCPIGKDTCAGAGLDPVSNYMDYSTDVCYTNFTTGQDSRADFMMSTYRPVIGSAAKTLASSASSIANARELGGGLVDFKAVPNPFNPRTKIEFGLSREGRASVRIFDIQGRLVSTVVDRRLAAGNHSFDFDGARLASGVYFMSLKADGKETVKRLSLLK